MNFLAMFVALAGSPSLSPITNCNGWPLTPPALLILSTAISATSLVGMPILAAGPVRSKNAPSLIGSAASAAPAQKTIITSPTRIRFMLFLLSVAEGYDQGLRSKEQE